MLISFYVANVLGGEISDLVWQTGPVAKCVLAALLIFSVFSWAIILQKLGLMSRARTQSARFQRAFRKASRLQDVAAVAEQFKPSPLVAVFDGAYEELKKQGGIPPRFSAQCRSLPRKSLLALSDVFRGSRRLVP
jgi:biopolymer transport protein TolQ